MPSFPGPPSKTSDFGMLHSKLVIGGSLFPWPGATCSVELEELHEYNSAIHAQNQ